MSDQSTAPMKEYPPVPTGATLFLRDYGYTPVKEIVKWEWSVTFGKWGAVVIFPDDYKCYTFPRQSDNKRNIIANEAAQVFSRDDLTLIQKIMLGDILRASEVCARCGATIAPMEPGGIFSNYGTNREGDKFCFPCCADNDRDYMRQHGAITLYLTIDPAYQIGRQTSREVRNGGSRLIPRDSGKITNFPGSLTIAPSMIQWSRHNWGLPRYDVWFTFEGATWHGVKIGNDTDLVHCKRNKPLPPPKVAPHYIAGGGLRGYLYNFCDWFTTKGAAAQYIADIHDLSQRAMIRLRRDLFIDLDLSQHGNEYGEITVCYCDDPDCHSDSPSF